MPTVTGYLIRYEFRFLYADRWEARATYAASRSTAVMWRRQLRGSANYRNVRIVRLVKGD